MKIEWAFCSLGDLITLAELTFHLGKVIEAKKDFDGQRAEEYEALERSISNFGNTLLKVMLLSTMRGAPVSLSASDLLFYGTVSLIAFYYPRLSQSTNSADPQNTWTPSTKLPAMVSTSVEI